MAPLALYWSVMIACYLLASRLRRYADRLGFVNTLLSVSVYALVFVMGLRMGANREVTDNLGVIGVQALLVTALTMAFSMLGAFAVRKLCGDHTAGVRERRNVFSYSHRRSLPSQFQLLYRIWAMCVTLPGGWKLTKHGDFRRNPRV